MRTTFIHFDEDENNYACDVRVDSIDMIVDKKKGTTGITLRGGYHFVVGEGYEHVKTRLERLR